MYQCSLGESSGCIWAIFLHTELGRRVINKCDIEPHHGATDGWRLPDDTGLNLKYVLEYREHPVKPGGPDGATVRNRFLLFLFLAVLK